MKRTAFMLLMLLAVAALPSIARADEQRGVRPPDPAKMALIAGVIVGGGVGYLVAEDVMGVLIGAATGGVVGAWWHSTGDRFMGTGTSRVSDDPERAGSLFQLISLPGRARSGLSLAVSSRAAD
jgi:hypothetical protein